MMNRDQTIETLLNCIEELLNLLKETHQKERAQEIYEKFFGK